MQKKITIIAILLMAICTKIAANDQLTISNFTLEVGETNESLRITLTNDQAYSGYQFDLYLPDGLTVNGYSVGNRHPSGFNLTMGQQNDGSYRFVGASLSGDTIPDSSGSIIELTVAASGNMSPGAYTGYFRNIKLSTPTGSGPTYAEQEFGISITKVVLGPAVVLGETEYIYDGTAKEPTVTVKDGDTVIPTTEYEVSYSNNTDAGTATVTITDADGGFYTVNASAEFTIAAKTVSSPVIELSQTVYTYDGTAKTPDVVSVKDGDTTIPASEYTVSYADNTDVGTGTVTISDADGGNYTVSGSAQFSIVAAVPGLTPPTAKTGLVYSGAAQDLINAGSTTAGTLQYSLDGVTYATAIPQGTNAQSYTVYYKVDGDANHEGIAAQSINITITKAPLRITARSYSVKQGKNLPTFGVDYSGFKNNETESVLTTKPTVTTNATKNSEPGTYAITVSGADARNYAMTYVNGTLTITAKTENFDGNVLTVENGGNIDDALESIGGRTEAAKTITAIVWNSDAKLTSDMLQGIDNPNLLIYVNSKDLAPEGRNNVVIDGVAKYVKLTDTGTGNCNFSAPKEFTADSIVYTREFKQKTEVNVSRGWEGICLPFTVQTFTHETHGELAPFGSTASSYHFWLRKFTEKGVVNAETIEANQPYIISMPNNEAYYEEHNQAGVIKFASANVTVPITEPQSVWLGDSAQITSTFSEVDASEYIYALNVNDSIMNSHEGSIFVSNYRNVRPFEVYTFHEPGRNEGYGSRIISLASIFGGNGYTGMDVNTIDSKMDVWYDLRGQRLQRKPTKSGLYIRNGKKVVIK